MTGRKSSGNKTKPAAKSAKSDTATRVKASSPETAQSGASTPSRVTTPVPPPPAAKTATSPSGAQAAKTPKPGLIPKPPAAANAGASSGLSNNTSPESSQVEMKKQELMAKVVERSDVAKKHAKPVIEAMLEVLGEAIGEGRELNLQPFGKLKHNRIKDTPAARIIVAKIRQPKAQAVSAKPGKEPVADPQE